jgi:N-acetylneuraminic acid mutarotase
MAFNTTSGAWQRLPPAAADIPEGRQHGFGSIVGDTFYVTGGRGFNQLDVRGTVFELDLNNQSAGWQTSPGYMPVPRGGLSGDVVRKKIYSFGGEGNPNSLDGVFNETEAFDTTTQRWTKLMPMAVPRHGTHAVAVGNKVYIPGGGLQQDGKAVLVNGTTQFSDTSAHFDAYCT